MDIKINKKKNVVQDVVPGRRSIRDVELPSRSKSAVEKTSAPRPARPVPVRKEKPEEIIPDPTESLPPRNYDDNPSYKYEYDEPKKSSKKLLYTAVVILVVALLFGISAFFRSATIKITPRNQSVQIDDVFSAKKDSPDGGLSYQVVTISKDMEKSVTATGEQNVSRKATGRIVIYNNFSSQSQKLVENTRFQTPEGLIFHLTKTVDVPGSSVKSGKTVAGSLEADVVADQAGDKYNIGLKDFTIPGFKGTPKYTKIYARSKTEMTGGFVGTEKVVSKDELDKADNELQSGLKDFLSKEISSQIPANFILYADTLTYDLSPVTQASSGTSTAVLRKKGTANAVIFDKGVLSRIITAKILPSASNDVVKITNLESLAFSYKNPGSFNPNLSNSLDFNLKGNVNFVWVFDENKLKSDLLGLSKDQGLTVMATYKSIKEAWIETSPFWNKTIPSNSEKVTLVNTLDSALTK